MRRMRRTLSLVLFLSCLAASPALAHKVNIFAVVEGGRIVGEGYFSGGDKAKNSPVEVRDASGKLVAQTRTDEAGAFSLPAPADAPPPLRLILKAGEGHQNDYVLTAQDLGMVAGAKAQGETAVGAMPAAADAKAQDALTAGAKEPNGATAGTITSTSSTPLPATELPVATAGQPSSGGLADRLPGSLSAPSAEPSDRSLPKSFEDALGRALDAKLAPLQRQLMRLEERSQETTLRDVVGGLGWIVGLFGAAAWMRRPRDPNGPRDPRG